MGEKAFETNGSAHAQCFAILPSIHSHACQNVPTIAIVYDMCARSEYPTFKAIPLQTVFDLHEAARVQFVTLSQKFAQSANLSSVDAFFDVLLLTCMNFGYLLPSPWLIYNPYLHRPRFPLCNKFEKIPAGRRAFCPVFCVVVGETDFRVFAHQFVHTFTHISACLHHISYLIESLWLWLLAAFDF